jgi:hypothetical protein
MKRLVCGRAAVAVALVGMTVSGVSGEARGGPAAAGAAAPSYLIYAGWYGNTIPTPSFVRDNRAFLETQPFDGLVLYLRNPSMTVNVTTGVMTGTPMSYETMMSVLEPVRGLPFSTLTQNFALIFGSTPPDFFDSWTVTVQNFANAARAVRDSGLKGIVFDNEQYFRPWANYPDGVRYPSRSLKEYQDQARLRGREVMQAMVAQFPEIVVVTLHGPYVSEPKAPSSLGFPQWWMGNELLGPFFAGFMEGKGAAAVNVDGGELYTLRTAEQFQGSYLWRRYDIASDAVNCAFIPPALRAVWPDRSNIGFGVYDRPFGGASMDPTILRATIANALRQADRYVWFYAEASTYLLPPSRGGASDVWVSALRQGRLDAAAGTAPAAPANLRATAVSPTRVDLVWTDGATNESGFRIERKTGVAGTWSQVATPGANATSWSDATVQASTAYVYRVRAYNAAGASAWSNEAGVTTPAPPPPSSGGTLRVTSFTLINADTDEPIAGFDPLQNGTILNLGGLPTRNLSVRANTDPATVGSVRFEYDGDTDYRIENARPYCIAGDGPGGDYLPWTPSVGTHALTGVPYTNADAGGAAGEGLTIAFSVVDLPPAGGVPGGGGASCGLLGAEGALGLLVWGAARRWRRARRRVS